MRDRVFVDSNIFLYAFSNKDSIKQEIASTVVRKNHTISTQVINEVSNNLIKKLKFNNMKVAKFIEVCYEKYQVANVDREAFLSACDIRERYNISYYDSLIVASAIVSRCNILYSEDMQHNQKIDTITIINPFKA